MDHQYHFFEQLQMRFASRQAMVGEVATTLGLSKDAIYRRLRGTTVLSTNELVQLSHHYGVRLSNPGDAHYFAFNHAETVIRSPGDYLAQLTDRLTKIQRLSNLFIYLANPGLPFFHEMVYPRLFAFKLFIYGSTCWNFPGWRDRKFSVDLIDRKVLEQARAIGEYSYTVPGRELWTMGMLRATLDQIEGRKGFRYGQAQRDAYAALGGTPFLDRDYTVFGRVIEGLEVIDAIATAQTAPGDRPVEDIAMKMRVIK